MQINNYIPLDFCLSFATIITFHDNNSCVTPYTLYKVSKKTKYDINVEGMGIVNKFEPVV